MSDKIPEEEDVDVPESAAQANMGAIRTLFRQNSEKFGQMAEEVVLPKSQRTFASAPIPEEIPMSKAEDVESQSQPQASPYQAPTTIIVVKQHYAATARAGSDFPIFMLTISFLQVLLFYTVDSDWLMLLFGYDPHRRHELWRFWTIMLVHSGMSHLWGNVIFQMILGVLLEVVHGWKRMGIIYLASVLGGSLFISVLGPKTYGVGASAGVYGLLFSHLSTIILNWNEMDRKCCRLFWLLLYMAFDIGGSLWIELHLQQNTNTSHAGHLGGAVTGFLVSILVLRNFEKHLWEVRMQKICQILLISAFALIVLINFSLSFTSFYIKEEWNIDYEHSYEKYIVHLVVESPEDSPVRRSCEQDLHCKLILDQYNFNGTVPDSIFSQ